MMVGEVETRIVRTRITTLSRTSFERMTAEAMWSYAVGTTTHPAMPVVTD